MFRSVMILASALALMACDGPTKPKAAQWYEGTWVAQGLPVRDSGRLDPPRLDSLWVMFDRLADFQALDYTSYYRGEPQPLSGCPGFLLVSVRGDTVYTRHDRAGDPYDFCGDPWYERTYVRSGADLTTKWGAHTVRLVRKTP